MKIDKKEIASLYIITVVIFLFCLPFLKNINNIYYEQEWLDSCSYQLLAQKSLCEYRQFPLWSPYFGGGYPFIGHPQNLFLCPFLMLFIFLDVWAAYKIYFLINFLIGGWGFFYLARRTLNYTLLGALFSSLLFVLTSFFPYHLHTGNLYFVNYFYFPILFSFFIKAVKNYRYLLLSGLLLSFMIVNGLTIYWLGVLLFLFLFSIFNSLIIENRSISFKKEYTLNLLFAVIISLLLAAVQLLPLAEIITQNMRAFANYAEASRGSLNMANFYLALFTRGPYKKPADWFPDGIAADSVMYFGWVPLLLCLCAFIIFFREKQTKVFLFLLSIFIVLTFGSNGWVDLFKLLWYLPFFHSMHSPPRCYSFYVMFIITLMIGKLFSIFEGKRWLLIKIVVITMMIGSLTDMFWANRKYWDNLFDTPAPSLIAGKEFYHVQTYNNSIDKKGEISHFPDSYHYFWQLRNIGKINWEPELNLQERAIPRYFVDEMSGHNKLNPAYRGEVYLLKKQNKAKLLYFSPNKLVVQVDVEKPDVLVVNQNYNKYWKAKVGKVREYEGLISLPLMKRGHYKVEFVYHPLSFYLGIGISSIVLIGVLIGILKGKVGF